MVGQIFVDEKWYMSRYPDVVDALKDGDIATVSDHYNLFGYYEHRMPYQILVEEKWYLSEYPDIKEAVDAGVFPSGQTHFDDLGFREGRCPYPHFRLRLRSDRA